MHKFNINQVLDLLKSTTSHLALTYMAIIMLMSMGFSLVFYNTSSRQLDRQIPPTAIYGSISRLPGAPQVIRTEFNDFFQQRIEEGRQELLVRLIWLNILALAGGGVLSCALARRTLQPIEEAMEAQNRFVSDASHELRTPITVLQTTNEVALRKPKLSADEAKDLIQHNVAEAVKLKSLTDSLLSLLKQTNRHVKFEPASLQNIATDAMNNVVAVATAKQIAIHDTVPDIKVVGNKQMLVQLATILLDNAVKYSKPNTSVELTAFTKRGKGYLAIKDSGIGIHASDIPHIFDRFYRADRSRGKDKRDGYGLGLSIAYNIVQQHHGDIIVTSKPDHGSTFTVEMSLANKH